MKETGSFRFRADPQLLITVAEQIGGPPGAGLLMIYNQIVELGQERDEARAQVAALRGALHRVVLDFDAAFTPAQWSGMEPTGRSVHDVIADLADALERARAALDDSGETT